MVPLKYPVSVHCKFPKYSNFFNFTLFADDSILTCAFENTSSDEISNLQSTTIKDVFHRIIVNKLKVNTSKCKFINFSYRKKTSLPLIIIDCCIIIEADGIQFLNVPIDKHLAFISYINTIFSKLSKTVGSFNRLEHFLPPEIMKTLYHSLVHPYLNCSIETKIWYGKSLVSTRRASVLQKKVIRAVYNLPYNDHTSDYFKTSKILKIGNLYKNNLCNHIIRSNASDINNYISQFLQPHSAFHDYNTRIRNNLVVPRFARSWCQLSFLHRSVKEFNSLPHEIKNSRSLSVFKLALKNSYCSEYKVIYAISYELFFQLFY